MNHQDLINTCVFEQIQGLLFSDLSGPLNSSIYSVVLNHGSLRSCCKFEALIQAIINS